VRNFDRQIDQSDYRWKTFWNNLTTHQNHNGSLNNDNKRKNSIHQRQLPIIRRWTLEISGLDERFAANFLDKFDSGARTMPFKSPDDLSYYVTLATDPNLARDGNKVIPLAVGIHYVNKLEGTGLKCNGMQYVNTNYCSSAEGDGGSDVDNSPSVIWTLTEWR
jgi:hypothetical protein